MSIHPNVTATVGRTPLIRLNSLARGLDATIAVKGEFFNPLGSVKDRIGAAMIDAAEQEGILSSATTIIEPTSGNTGIALAFVAAIKPGITSAIFAIVLTAWPPYARLARAETLSLRNTDFIAAVRLTGASSARIVLRHIVPLCLGSLVVRVTLDMSSIILTAASLGFLGLGAPPPTPEDALALEAVDLFLAVLGAEAGAMGLRCLATGGVYLAGGITPRLIDRIAGSGGLVDAFLWPASRFSTLLRTFPLYAVTNDGLGLLGARVVAARALAKTKQ